MVVVYRHDLNARLPHPCTRGRTVAFRDKITLVVVFVEQELCLVAEFLLVHYPVKTIEV